GQVLAGLGQCDHLCVGSRRTSDLVPGRRVAVDGVDAAVAPDHLGQGDRDVAAARADVGTAPALAQAEAEQRGFQWPAVDVVAQALELTHGAATRRPVPPWVCTLRVGWSWVVLVTVRPRHSAGQRRGGGAALSSMSTTVAISAGHHTAISWTRRSPSTMLTASAPAHRPNRIP